MSASRLSLNSIQKPDHSFSYLIDVCLEAVIIIFNSSEFRVLISCRGLLPISERNELVCLRVDYQNRPVSVEPDRVVEGQKSVHAIIVS